MTENVIKDVYSFVKKLVKSKYQVISNVMKALQICKNTSRSLLKQFININK